MLRRNGRLAVALLVAGLGLAGCGGGEETTVDVTLQEFAVLPAIDTVPAGSVTFDATNEGPDDPHELVVIRTDLAPEDLPTAPEGAVDEEGQGVQVIGEIEEFPVGETRSGTFDLEAGDYVLVCNIVEEEGGEVEAHYALGMRIGFVVT